MLSWSKVVFIWYGSTFVDHVDVTKLKPGIGFQADMILGSLGIIKSSLIQSFWGRDGKGLLLDSATCTARVFRNNFIWRGSASGFFGHVWGWHLLQPGYVALKWPTTDPNLPGLWRLRTGRPWCTVISSCCWSSVGGSVRHNSMLMFDPFPWQKKMDMGIYTLNVIGYNVSNREI